MTQSNPPNRPFPLFAVVAVCFAILLNANLPAPVYAISGAAWQEAPPTEEEKKPGKSKDLKKDNGKKSSDPMEDEKDSKQESDEEQTADDKVEGEKVKGKGKVTKDEDAKTEDEKEESNKPKRRRRQSRAASNSRAGDSFLEVFRPVIADTARATVQIKSGELTIALGAIVDPNGYVLTKQSELESPLTCELNDGRKVAAHVFGVHPDTDLALLKIDADNLPVIRWANNDTLDIGHWLATVKNNDKPLGVGVVGVNARLIKPQSGFMGVNLRQTEKGVQITGVTPESPAQIGGLKSGDIIQKVNGESYTDITKLITKVKSFPPGEEVRLTLMRGNNEIVADVVLGEERSLNPLFERSNQQNTMGGNELSQRRQNFPLAIQHDTFLKPEECGGPVVNIDGDVVGFNIARQGRVSSLMLPSSMARSIADEMKSGQWAPALVNKDRIDDITRSLQDLKTEVALSPMNDDELKKQVQKLNKDEKKLREKLEKTLKERVRAEVELEMAEGKFGSATKEIERLEKEREALVTGSK